MFTDIYKQYSKFPACYLYDSAPSTFDSPTGIAKSVFGETVYYDPRFPFNPGSAALNFNITATPSGNISTGNGTAFLTEKYTGQRINTTTNRMTAVFIAANDTDNGVIVRFSVTNNTTDDKKIESVVMYTECRISASNTAGSSTRSGLCVIMHFDVDITVPANDSVFIDILYKADEVSILSGS